MSVNDTAIAGRPQRHVVRSMIVSVLAMAALLLGLFAVHSAAAGHEMDVTVPAVFAHAEHTGATGMVASAGAVVAVASSMDGGWLSFDDGFMAGCGVLAMTCSVLLIVVALIRLARQSSAYRRLLDAGGFAVSSFRTIPLHVHRPSLTLLSISRI